MSTHGTAEGAARRAGSGIARAVRAWRGLAADRRLAAAAALGLWLTLFLPWYQETGFAPSGTNLRAAAASLTGWHAFSWVEAAVLLVAIAVLALLFMRAEGRAFHLPGGDGFIVMVAGGWTCLLLIWRIFDKQGATTQRQFGTTFGVKWGIFTALGVAALLTYAGARIRAAHQPEPLLPGEEPGAGGASDQPWGDAPPARHTRRAVAAGATTAATRRPAAVPASAANERKAKRARSDRAGWAEPVTWEEPTPLPEPLEPSDDSTSGEESGHTQLRIPLDD